jgi:hypothetical protein
MAGETEVLEENLLQFHYIHYKYHQTCPGIQLGPARWEAGD